MPIIKKQKTLEIINNSISFKNKIKENKKVLLPNTTCDLNLVESFKKEAKDKNNEDNDYQLNEMILNEDMFPLKEKVLRKTELSKSSASIKQFNININNNENIKSLKAKIAKPKKERKVYTTIYIKSSINDKMQALAEQFNISKGELLENIFIEFTK